MKVALTVWKDRISPVFDVSKEAMLIEVLDDKIQSTCRFDILASTTLGKIRWFVEQRITVLICGAISESLFREFKFHQITVHGFITGPLDEVIGAFLQGNLDEERFAMPGCGRGCRGRRDGRHNRRRGLSGT